MPVRAPTETAMAEIQLTPKERQALKARAHKLNPVELLGAHTKVYDALSHMRRTSSHLVLVAEEGRPVGVVTMADLLKGLFPISEQPA